MRKLRAALTLLNADTAYLIGNVIQQPASNQNSNMVSYGAEGPTNPGQNLYVVNNTFINDQSDNGLFFFVSKSVTTPVLAQNNVFAGTGEVAKKQCADTNQLPLIKSCLRQLRPL